MDCDLNSDDDNNIIIVEKHVEVLLEQSSFLQQYYHNRLLVSIHHRYDDNHYDYDGYKICHIIPKPSLLSSLSFLYMFTINDEFYKDLVIVYDDSKDTSNVKYSHKQRQSFMDYYNPIRSSPLIARLPKKMTIDLERQLIAPNNTQDTNLFIQLLDCKARSTVDGQTRECFEPLFAYITVYTTNNNGDAIRVSETICIDLTTKTIKDTYLDLYDLSSQEAIEVDNNKQIDLSTIKITKNRDLDSYNSINSVICSMPNAYCDRDLYLLVQIVKVLTHEPEKAIAPYSKYTVMDIEKRKNKIRRLFRYRQNVGIGVVKLFNDQGIVGSNGGPNIVVPVYAQKICWNDQTIGQIIKEIFPGDGSKNRERGLRNEMLDLDLYLRIFNVGKDNQLNTLLAEALSKCQIPPNTAVSILPSQHGSSITQTNNNNDKNSDTNYDDGPNLLIRTMKTFSPISSLNIMMELENTIYIYPLAFEKFQDRNLCLKVELVEFEYIREDHAPTADDPHIVLQSIYNPMPGQDFCVSRYTTVSYHTKTPSLNDEIKIKLPDFLNNNHYIKLTVQHVHIKPQKEKMKLTNILFTNEECGPSYSEIGVGLVPLLQSPANNLLKNGTYSINIISTEDEEEKSDKAERRRSFVKEANPSVVVEVRSFCSFFSSCKNTQRVFYASPVPLGYLLSSRVLQSNQSLLESYQQASINHIRTSEDKLLDSITDFYLNAIEEEIKKHFLALFRVLLRCMIGGSCVFQSNYANPYNHTKLRCISFLSFLHILRVVSPDMNTLSLEPGIVDLDTKEKILHSIVDLLFDEDIPENTNKINRPDQEESELVMIEENDAFVNSFAEHITSQVERVILEELLLSSKGNLDLEQIVSSLDNLGISDIVEQKSNSDNGPVIYLQPFVVKYQALSEYEFREKEYLSSGNGATDDKQKQWWPFSYEILVIQIESLLQSLQQPVNGAHTTANSTKGIRIDQNNSYPFTVESLPWLFGNTLGNLNNLRQKIIDLTPVLLKIILKSLNLRIYKEHLKVPLLFDDDFLAVLTSLIACLTKEIYNIAVASSNFGLRSARNFNAALSQFIVSLLSIVAPCQVQNLVAAYLENSHVTQTENAELRYHMLKEVTSFRDIVAINFSLTTDATLSVHEFIHDMNNEKFDIISKSGQSQIYTPFIPYMPPRISCMPCWLSKKFAEEGMRALASNESMIRQMGIGILRDNIVRQLFDSRYNTPQARGRIALSYLPLFRDIINETSRISKLHFEASDRREVLSIFVCLIQELPNHVLRNEIRKLCNFDVAKTSAEHLLSSSPSVFHLIHLMHLLLDTFEIPLTNSDSDGISQYLALIAPNITLAVNDNSFESIFESGKRSFRSSLEPLGRLAELEVRRQSRSSAGSNWKQNVKNDDKRKWYQMSNTYEYEKVDNGISSSVLEDSAIGIRRETLNTVIKVLALVFDECPRLYPLALNIDNNESGLAAILQNCLALILHGFYSNDSTIGDSHLLTISTIFIKSFGAKAFVMAAGDSLQDWMRSLMLSLARMTDGAVFLVILLESSMKEYGSITVIRKTILAVLEDVIDKIISDNENVITNSDDEMRVLDLLKLSLTWVANNLEEGADNVTKTMTGSEQTQFASFYIAVSSFIEDLDLVIDAYLISKRVVNPPLPMNWDDNAINNLDVVNAVSNRPPLAPSRMSLSSSALNRRSASPSNSTMKDELNNVITIFFEVSELFDPILLPRQKIRWLQRIGRLHDDNNNIAEAADIRCRIYNICAMVEPFFDAIWAPKAPFEWKRRSVKAGERGIFSKNNNRNFIELLEKSFSSPGRLWKSNAELNNHMEKCLMVAAEKFFSKSLVYLGERVSQILLDRYRESNKISDMAIVYSMITTGFKTLIESSSSNVSYALGTFYVVQFSGRILPKHLRDKEFVYRNGRSLPIADFEEQLKLTLQKFLGEDVVIKISHVDLLQKPSVIEKEDRVVYLYINSIKPVQDYSSNDNSHVSFLKSIKHFSYSVPFTQDGKKHAKTFVEQWKKLMLLSVARPYPGPLVRQIVEEKVIRILSPIEVFIEDIEEKIVELRQEYERVGRVGTNNDLSNLMRLVQGAIVPQVNVGLLEAAKTFLAINDTLTNTNDDEDDYSSYRCTNEQKNLLKMKIVTIIHICKELLGISGRRISSLVSLASPDRDEGNNDDNNENKINRSNITWQQTIEQKYDVLVDSIILLFGNNVKSIKSIDTERLKR